MPTLQRISIWRPLLLLAARQTAGVLVAVLGTAVISLGGFIGWVNIDSMISRGSPGVFGPVGVGVGGFAVAVGTLVLLHGVLLALRLSLARVRWGVALLIAIAVASPLIGVAVGLQ